MGYLSNACPKNRGSKSAKRSAEEEISSCSYTLHSFHLFWGNEVLLPHGEDLARGILGQLGNDQLHRAQGYLSELWDKQHVIPAVEVDEATLLGRTKKSKSHVKKKSHSKFESPIQESEEETSVHEIYHNLRKELRSFLDEVDLFGTLLLPGAMVSSEIMTVLSKVEEDDETNDSSLSTLGSPINTTNNVAEEELGPQISPPVDPNPSLLVSDETKQKTFEALTSLKQTRKLLGDLNDDYTAYAT